MESASWQRPLHGFEISQNQAKMSLKSGFSDGLGGGKNMPSLPPPLKPPAAPPTPPVVLPKNVRQAAASQVDVRGNGGIVLVLDVNLSSCYSSTPPSLGVRNWKVVLQSLLVMRKSVCVMMSMPSKRS